MHNAIPSIFLPLLVEVLEKGGVRFALGGGSVSITRLHTDLKCLSFVAFSAFIRGSSLSCTHSTWQHRTRPPTAEGLLHAGARRGVEGNEPEPALTHVPSQARETAAQSSASETKCCP